MDVTSSLTIETEVFGKGLENAESIGVIGEMSDRPGICGQISRGETLISIVKSNKMVLSQHNF